MRPPLILVWCDPWFNIDETARLVVDHCALTADRARLEAADAVVFPVPTMIHPGNAAPAARGHAEQCWVVWSQECSVHFPQLSDPSFLARFDLTMTYRFDSDVPIPYLQHGMFDRLQPAAPVALRQAAPVVAFVSSRWDACGRSDYLEKLLRHVQVDSYGDVCNNHDLADDRGRSTKLETISAYRFTVAFENAIEADYVTEKFFDPLLVGSVPIYRGAPNVAEFAPGDDCYIDVAEFAGPQELAQFLATMTNETYERYHQWRGQPLRAEFVQRCDRVADHAILRLVRLLPVLQFGRRAAAARHRDVRGS